MPSAAVKAEQKFQEGMEPVKQVMQLVEKKVRNLEKRKGKLEDYKAKEKKGEVLSEEQKNACARLDEVNQHLEMAKDLQKQFLAVSQDAEKNLKRQIKKEKAERHEDERKRLAQALQFKSLVDYLRSEESRNAFLQGTDGAVKVADEELATIEDFYKLVFTERTKEGSYGDHVLVASEHLQNLLDAKDKTISGLQAVMSYKQLKELLDKIEQSSYFTGFADNAEVKECTADSNNSSAVEQDFVVVKSTDVPSQESPEVLASLPPAQSPENQEESDEQYPIDESITIYNQRIEKAFQEIVSSGKINFLQDSLIDIDAPSHADPAVLQVMPQQSSYVTTQNPEQVYPPDAPQPIPMPNHDSTTDDNKLFTMNADAPAFETKNHTDCDNENSTDNDGFHQPGRSNRGRFLNSRGRGRANGYRNGSGRGGNQRGMYQSYQSRPEIHSDNSHTSFNGGSHVPNNRRGSGGPRGHFNKDYQPRGNYRGRGSRGSYHHDSQQRPVPTEAEA